MNRKQRRAKAKIQQASLPKRQALFKQMPMSVARTLLEHARREMANEQFLAAYQSYQRIFESEHANPSLLVEIAKPLIRISAMTELESLCEQGVRRFPDSAVAWNLLGQTRFNLGRPESALSAYKSALKHDPAMVQAIAGMSQVQERIHLLDAALESIDLAVRLDPGFLSLHFLRGMILRRLGHFDGAIEEQRLVLRETHPDMARERHMAWCEIASIEKQLNRLAASKDALQAGKQEQAKLREPLLEQFPLFQHVTEERFRGLDRSKATTWARGLDRPRACAQGLIVGHPRSGTTLVEQIVAAHPEAVTLDEREAMVQAESACLGSVPTVPVLDRVTNELASRYYQSYRREAERYLGEPIGGRMLVDKRPDSMLLLPTVLRMMPDCRIVVVIRDPRDVCASCYEQAFQLSTISAQFHSIASTCRFYAWFMSYWVRMKKLLPRTMWHEVRYEHVVQDTEQYARELVGFLGLPWSDEILAFSKRAETRLVSTPSYAAVAEPVTSASVGRWSAYADEFEAVEDTLAPYITAFGYDRE